MNTLKAGRPARNEPHKKITISLPIDILYKIAQLAEQEERTMIAVIKRLLEKGLTFEK